MIDRRHGVLLLALAGGGGSYAVWRLAAVRSARRERADGLEAVQHLAEDDVTEHGEQLQHLGNGDEISTLTDLLADGRYSLACVRARVGGEPVPERRVRCFFNPRQVPSRTGVLWTTGRHGIRPVPACQQCSARLAAREKPDVRTVTIGPTGPVLGGGRGVPALHPRLLPPGAAGAAGIAAVWAPVTDAGGVGSGSDGGSYDHGSGGFGGGVFDGGGGE